MPTDAAIRDLLRPENLNSVKGLALLARMTVAGLSTGINASRRTGTGQEFSQYRHYQPGDDLRSLDWKMYARSERLYVRESEIETHTTVQFILDTSASMLHEENGIRKLDYARYLIATLAWLAQNQGDELGLIAFNNLGIKKLPPQKKRGHFHRFLHQLTQLKAEGLFPKAQAIQECSRHSYKRHILVFISDLYEDDGEISEAIKQFKHPKNDVILFQLMGKQELSLDFGKFATFQDLETRQTIQVEQGKTRTKYKQKLQEHMDKVKKTMLKQGIDTHVLSINESAGFALRQFLKTRVPLNR